MTTQDDLKNRRILLIDDNRSIHEDFMTILDRHTPVNPALDDAESALFGPAEPVAVAENEEFEIDSAFQGEEGINKIRRAMEENRPYAMAFVDVRMPPGIDGIETVHRIWEEYPQLQVVICTAYSDYDWNDIVAKLGKSDQLLILKKPFDNIEVYQLASALTEKWNYARLAGIKQDELETKVEEKTSQIQEANRRLTTALRQAKADNDQLNVLVRKAMAANDAKNQFLANMSHELKTPMNAIMGFSELLKSQHLDMIQSEYVDIICQSANHLLTLIDNILDYAELSSGQFEPTISSCRLQDLLDYLDGVMRPVAEEKRLRFEINAAYGLPRLIHTDEPRLKQCLLNLIGNAIKFTNQGTVRIDVYPDEDDHTRLRFEIKDTGVGIAPDKQPDVFSAFMLGDGGSTRAHEGIGLGLATTNQLAEFLGGKLLFSSEYGKGSVFTLILPVTPDMLASVIRKKVGE